ncbi:MAG: response regulator [Polyangiaceae bacterium]|nr:response regulator [Polyangiaceae bacterium]
MTVEHEHDPTLRADHGPRLCDDTYWALAVISSLAIAFEWDVVRDRVRRLQSNVDELPATESDTLEGVLQVVHPSDRDVFRANARSALESEDGIYQSEFRIIRPNGEVRWLGEFGRVEFDANHRPLRLVGISHDITDHKRAEEALKEADRRKDEFLAMLAHELRNPLAPILNAVQLLRLIGPVPLRQQKLHDVLERQVNQLARLVDDLLDVSRVSRGKVQLRKAFIHLDDVVGQAIETSRPLIDARNHHLTVNVPLDPILLDGDFARLAQVVSNLLNNAAKYTDEGGCIELNVDRVMNDGQMEAVIRVADNGRGMDPQAMRNLFQLFYQVDRNLDRSEGGLGIGLSLVKNLVEMHGGRVEAHSAGRGKGSEFVVRLPVRVDDVAPRKPNGGAPRTMASSGLRVLVVDDNRDAADTLAQLLEVEGHEVLRAYDGKGAVENALETRPDVILLDIGLPHMSGFDACRAMRHGGLNHAVIIATTGYGQDDDRRLSREAGFDAHLVKPVDLQTIRNVLASRAAKAA